MEFQSFKIIQDFKKVYMRRFLFCLIYVTLLNSVKIKLNFVT